MNIILVAGSDLHTLQPVWQTLQALGVQAAKPSRREGLLPESIHDLMGQALAHHLAEGVEENLDLAVSPKILGKVWHELATDLFLGNIGHRIWGWPMQDTAFLLDYWLDFDPGIRLMLVYSSPIEHLQHQLQDADEVTPHWVEQALAQWNQRIESLLVRFHAHSPRCVLVHADSVKSQTTLLAQVIGSQWAMPGLTTVVAPLSALVIPPSTYQQGLLELMVGAFPETKALWQELEATAHLNASVKLAAQLTPYLHWAQLAAATRVQVEQTNQVLAFEKQVQVATQKIADMEAHNARCEADKAQLASAGESQTAANAKTLAHALAQREAHAQENELLLLQLHQVQEELEQIFLKHQRLESVAAQSSEQLQALQAALAAATSVQVEQTHQVLAFEKQVQAATQKIADMEADNARCEADKAQLASAGESQTAANAKTLAHALAQREAHAQENELLLLQLHQVQEELEHYFLQLQNATQQHKRQLQPLQWAADFWQRHPPEVLMLNMCQDIECHNWYHAEVDGRWVGPELSSTLQMPPLQGGCYQIELHVKDTMDPAILLGAQLSVIGTDTTLSQPVELVHDFAPQSSLCPMVSVGLVDLPTQHIPWTLQLSLPFNVCPADSGGNDTRRLGLKLLAVRLIRQSQIPDTTV